MPATIARLTQAGLATPPSWLPNNTMFEAITGSFAYGCNLPGSSDEDLVGFCIPPKHIVFPHLDGYVPGFGEPPEGFAQYEQHHIKDKSSRKEYDVTIYGLPKFLSLCADNNPNMVDSLFSPRRCIKHSTALAEHIRDQRRIFLHKGAYHRFRGYAYSQLTKMQKQGARRQSERRQAAIDKHGFDTKFGYHIIRLALECEQILQTGDLILDRDRETYKSIRNGEWSLDRITEWFEHKEKGLETLYQSSSIQAYPDMDRIKRILIECLEMHYGSLANAVVERDPHERILDDLTDILHRHRPALFAVPDTEPQAPAGQPDEPAP